jgi:hypothetical protein
MVYLDVLEDDEAVELDQALGEASATEMASLERLTQLLEGIVAKGEDPKYSVVLHYLRDRNWLEMGCIVFSQFFDTSEWVAQRLAGDLQGEPIALYAGAGRSGV